MPKMKPTLPEEEEKDEGIFSLAQSPYDKAES